VISGRAARRLVGVGLAAVAVVLASCGGNEATETGGQNPPGTSVPSSRAPTSAPGTTAAAAAAGTTAVPSTTTSSSPADATTSTVGATTSTARGATPTTPVVTQPYPTSVTTFPPGTSAADKAWCAQAKPITASLVAIYSLTLPQLEELTNQARALQPSAPAALQPALRTLDDIGGRFLAAVKAGRYTISPEGVARLANENLTYEQQQGFLRATGDLTAWINATC
jgi:hypothetical protein